MNTSRPNWIALLSVCTLFATGCGELLDGDEALSTTFQELDLTPEIIAGTLNFLNDASTDLERLDIDCHFYRNAAKATIRVRNGHDKDFPSDDDNLFTNWSSFASIAGIGPAHEQWAVDCAIAFGFVSVCQEAVQAQVYYDGDLPPNADLQAVIADLIRYAEWDSPETIDWGPFQLAEVTVYTECGEIVSVEVVVIRVIWPDVGVLESLHYTLDADLEVWDVWGDAG